MDWPIPNHVRVVQETIRYRLVETSYTLPPASPRPSGQAGQASDPHAGIQCLTCGYISWNPKDVAARYCGRCHASHEESVEAEPPGGQQ